MKKQTIILEVKFDDEEKSPNFWDWNSLLGCNDCIELKNYGKAEKIEENE